MLEINKFYAPVIPEKTKEIELVPTIVEEHHIVNGFVPVLRGLPKSKRFTAEQVRHYGAKLERVQLLGIYG